MMTRYSAIASTFFIVFLLFGCSSKPVLVEYQQPLDGSRDWYQIPADAPSVVEVQQLTVPQIQPFIQPANETSLNSTLSVTELVDSLGNPSLKINRQTGSAWEVVDSALTGLEWNITDRDRRNYKFELDQNDVRRGLFSRWFGNKDGILNLVLIPQGNETLIVVEGEENVLPDAELSGDILNTLFEYLDNA